LIEAELADPLVGKEIHPLVTPVTLADMDAGEKKPNEAHQTYWNT